MKIRDIRCMLLTAPIPQDKQFTSDIGTWKACHAAIAVVETDEGITGYGEAAGKSPLTMKSIIEHDLKPLLIGEDPTRVTYLWERMYNGTRLNLSLFYGRSQPEPHAPGEFMCAMRSVAVALWDIAGKYFGVPTYQLLGGKCRDKARVYYHVFGETKEELIEAFPSFACHYDQIIVFDEFDDFCCRRTSPSRISSLSAR